MNDLYNDIRTLQEVTKNIDVAFNSDAQKQKDKALYNISFFVRQMLTEKENLVKRFEEQDEQRASEPNLSWSPRQDVVKFCNELWQKRDIK